MQPDIDHFSMFRLNFVIMSWAAESVYEQRVGKDITLQKPIIITLDNDGTPIQIEVKAWEVLRLA